MDNDQENIKLAELDKNIDQYADEDSDSKSTDTQDRLHGSGLGENAEGSLSSLTDATYSSESLEEEDVGLRRAAEALSEDEHVDDSTSEDGDKRHPQRDPETLEDKFMIAIENGEVITFMDMLAMKDELNLDLNYKNENGDTPLRLAITLGSSALVETLLLHGVYVGDALLRAVDIGFDETVQKICNHASNLPTPDARTAILNCHCEGDDYHPDVTPIVLAAQRNDFILVKLLRDCGCKIDDIGSQKGKSSSKASDDLQKSVGSLEIYKGLASEAYLSQVNEDPIETSFRLSRKLRNLSHTDVEFKMSYLELAETTDVVGTEIISYARDTEEILTVLNHQEGKTLGEDTELIGPLPKISQGLHFNQKRFVAHQNCQQAVLSQFYGHMAFMRDNPVANKLLFFVSMVLCFPILSLLYLYVPVKWLKTYIGSPYLKFVLRFASDFSFVVLITADTILRGRYDHHLSLRRPTKIVLLLWVLGIAWRELKSTMKLKLAVLTQFNHFRDILLVVFFLTGILLDVVSYNYQLKENKDRVVSVSRREIYFTGFDDDFIPINTTHNWYGSLHDGPILHRVARQVRKPGKGAGPFAGGDNEPDSHHSSIYSEFLAYRWWHPALLANAMFALSTVISLIRMLPYVVVSNVIGPIQISLGSMVTRTAHFFLVVGIVLFSFAVGLCYIYSYYGQTTSSTCNEPSGSCQKGYFTNLFFAVLYLYWSALGLENQKPLRLDDQAHVLETAGLILYGKFYILLIIVLLNVFIAVMSKVYHEVEKNGDMEWKFHSTFMWMNIMLDEDVVPPPFNLLPSYQTIKHVIVKFKHRLNETEAEDSYTEDTRRKRSNWKDDADQYQRIMSQLVERYVLAKTAEEISVEADISFNDILGLRNDIMSLKVEMFQKLLNTKLNIDNTTVEGGVIRDTSTRAKDVLHKTEEIHENVDSDLKKTVRNFESGVEEQKSEIPTEPIYIADFGHQMYPFGVNQAVQFEADVREVPIQTIPGGRHVATQTGLDVVVVGDDEAAGGFVAQRVDEYEKLYPYQATL